MDQHSRPIREDASIWKSMRRLLLPLTFLIPLAVFLPTVGYEFVEWDDLVEVEQNPHIRSLSPDSLRWMFTNYDWVRRYQPLIWLGWGINYYFHGLQPGGYHLVNVVQHAVSATLMYLLVLHLLRAWQRRETHGESARQIVDDNHLALCAALAAILWAVHPLRAEPVAWVTGRIYTQCAMFFFGSLLCYVRSREPSASPAKRAGLYWLSVFSFVCALLSYPIVVGAAVVLLLLDAYPLRRFKGDGIGRWLNRSAQRMYLEKIPFLACAVVIGVLTVIARTHARTVWDPLPTLEQFPILSRALQGFYVWAYYCWMPLWPVGLAPIYPRLIWVNQHDLVLWFSVILVVAISLLCYIQRRRMPWLMVAWLFHLLMLLPLLGLTEKPHFTYDRYAHMRDLVYAVLLAGGLSTLWSKVGQVVFRKAVVIILMITAVFAVACSTQMTIWRNSEALFFAILEMKEGPYQPVIRQRLARYYARHDRWDEAIEQYNLFVQLNPQDPNVYIIKTNDLSAGAAELQRRGAPPEVVAAVQKEADDARAKAQSLSQQQ
jgi:protein O-mannosyl-transferase